MLVEEQVVLKTKLADAEKLLDESNKKYKLLSDTSQRDILSLKGQVEKVAMAMLCTLDLYYKGDPKTRGDYYRTMFQLCTCFPKLCDLCAHARAPRHAGVCQL